MAEAGGHNLLMIGPPGTGKTMLAQRIPSILPLMTLEEALETTKIHSEASALAARQALVSRRPFRSPHHTVSDAGLLGGGTHPVPGEVSLAHRGVLFLDELPEFHRNVIEVLRQPLEDGVITISRVAAHLAKRRHVKSGGKPRPRQSNFDGICWLQAVIPCSHPCHQYNPWFPPSKSLADAGRLPSAIGHGMPPKPVNVPAA